MYAEANALGVPVVAHKMGSAEEILHCDNPPIDCMRLEQVMDAVGDYYTHGIPELGINPEFELEKVISKWEELLQ